MNKLRGILIGLAFALPLAATGATNASDDAAVSGKSTTMTSVQAGPQSERCCFIWHVGMWWCIPC